VIYRASHLITPPLITTDLAPSISASLAPLSSDAKNDPNAPKKDDPNAPKKDDPNAAKKQDDPKKEDPNKKDDPKAAITSQQMQDCMPGLNSGLAGSSTPYMNAAMSEAGINTPARKAAFLAQLGHESGSLRWMQEIASGSAYEGRRDLGNVYPGDGRRYKGRGPIQLTGRANYIAASKALGIDLVNHPEWAASPQVGFRTAAWYWKTRNLNSYADRGDFQGITKRINGGYNGAADRNARYARCRRVMGN